MRLDMLRRFAIVTCVLGGCALSHEVGVEPGVIEQELHERFVGDWWITGPPRGGSDDSIYRFEPDGSLHEIVSGGHSVNFLPTGLLASEEEVCMFGNSWHSEGEDRLIIQVECGEARRDPEVPARVIIQGGTEREIALHLTSDPEYNAEGGRNGPHMTLTQVGDRAPDDYQPFGGLWGWRKCLADDERCQEFVRCGGSWSGCGEP